jgi:hypothetical protein
MVAFTTADRSPSGALAVRGLVRPGLPNGERRERGREANGCYGGLA